MSPSSDPDSKTTSLDQNRHSGQISSNYNLFPFIVPERQHPVYPSMALSSSFGGPCVYKHGNAHLWSGCYTIKDDGQLEGRKSPPELEKIRNIGESLQQTMARLSPYSLSACRLDVTSSNKRTELSGVWIRGLTRDIVLTVSRFKKDTKVSTSVKNTTAEVFTTLTGNASQDTPVKCGLFRDFNDPCGKRDFAIFVPCSDEDVRSPAQAVERATILPDTTSLSGIVISFGYNSQPSAEISNHPDPEDTDCHCINCWYGGGNIVCQKLDENLTPPRPHILGSGYRVLGIGHWSLSQGSHQIRHNVTGWYGISGAGMYSKDSQGNFRLMALFQCGILEGRDSDKNGAVIIPNDVLKLLGEAGTTEP